eukprot:gene25063-biopygen11966
MPAPRPRHAHATPSQKKMPIARAMPAPVSCSPWTSERDPSLVSAREQNSPPASDTSGARAPGPHMEPGRRQESPEYPGARF